MRSALVRTPYLQQNGGVNNYLREKIVGAKLASCCYLRKKKYLYYIIETKSYRGYRGFVSQRDTACRLILITIARRAPFVRPFVVVVKEGNYCTHFISLPILSVGTQRISDTRYCCHHRWHMQMRFRRKIDCRTAQAGNFKSTTKFPFDVTTQSLKLFPVRSCIAICRQNEFLLLQLVSYT